jgi:hypothetical protein
MLAMLWYVVAVAILQPFLDWVQIVADFTASKPCMLFPASRHSPTGCGYQPSPAVAIGQLSGLLAVLP